MPGVAAYLNDWSRTFAASVPEVIWSGTFFPEEGVAGYVGELVSAGVELFKLHLQVGEFHLDDPLLGDEWLRAVCWENGAELFGAERAVSP